MNNVGPLFGSQPSAAGLAQQPKQLDGPSWSAHDAPTQRAVTVLRTDAVARLSALGTAIRWGAMAGVGTSGAWLPSQARWLAVELTEATRRRGCREKWST
jgi:hypothetical protein